MDWGHKREINRKKKRTEEWGEEEGGTKDGNGRKQEEYRCTVTNLKDIRLL